MTIVAETNTEQKVQKVIWSYLKMLILGFGLTWLAIVMASYLNRFHPVPELYKTVFEYFGYICWVTSLGDNGLALFTWGKKTTAERLNRRLGQILSLLGVFAFVFARELN